MKFRITKELIELWLREIEKTGGKYIEIELKSIKIEDVGGGLLVIDAKRGEGEKWIIAR